jgi:TonB family protein
MAVRHEFSGETQSSESNERTDSQNPLNPKVGKPENIDILVSRFLDELSDISTEITQDENRAGSSQIEPKANENRVATQFRLPDDVSLASDPDLEKINEEIERSLAALERLRAGSARTKDKQSPNSQAQPAAAELPPTEVAVEIAETPVPVDSEEQARNRSELFRNSISAQKQPAHFSRGRVLAGAVLIGVLGIAAFFFFSSDNGAPEGVVRVQNNEPSKSIQTSGDIQMPVVTAQSVKPTGPSDKGKSAEQVKPTVRETKNRPVSSLTRNADTSGSSAQEKSTAKQDIKRPTQNGNGGASDEKPKIGEVPSQPAPQQAAAATVPPPEQPSLAANPPIAASQPKPNPIVSSGPPGNNGGNGAATPLVASTPEAPPAAPKPAPAAETQADNNSAQPKPRTVLMAEVLTRIQPVYPTIARARRISGTVEVEVEVNDKGGVIRAKAASGPDLLRSSAEQALMKWKFKPASVDGVNVPSKARISVSFSVQ